MKRKIITTALIVAVISAGCSSMNKTKKGAAIGVVGGAGIGAIIGKAAGNTAMGAVIGAAVGGTAGAIIGKKMDKQAEEIKNKVPDAEVIHKDGEEGIIVNFNSAVLFGFDKSDLTGSAKKTVGKLADVLNIYPDTDLLIEGHTDSKGTDAYNQTLSEKRANAVSVYLTKMGIASGRLTTKGFGESQPVASNDTEEGMAQNRRVTFIITANDKMKADAAKEAGK